MADDPEHRAGNPQLQAHPDGGGQRAVGNRHGARRTAQQDRLGQRAMQRDLEAGREARRSFVGGAHTTAPPENEKNDRKNEDAANAMDRPKTIWISLRKPPLVRSEEHTSELQSLMRISYAVFCLKQKTKQKNKD